MKVELTSQAETRRNIETKKQRESKSWSIFKSVSLVEAAHKARDVGWKDNKVQVRAERIAEDVIEYHVEPYEKGCGCKGMLRYEDYFD